MSDQDLLTWIVNNPVLNKSKKLLSIGFQSRDLIKMMPYIKSCLVPEQDTDLVIVEFTEEEQVIPTLKILCKLNGGQVNIIVITESIIPESYPLRLFLPERQMQYGKKIVSLIQPSSWLPSLELSRIYYKSFPRVLLAILVKDKEYILPLYLESILNMDYPKDKIILYIRTNDNKDNSEIILEDFIEKYGNQYEKVIYNKESVNSELKKYSEHDWNQTRFHILAKIRGESMRQAQIHNTDYYYVIDVDNLVAPTWLAMAVNYNLPIVAPLLLGCENEKKYYSNFFDALDKNGYYAWSERK